MPINPRGFPSAEAQSSWFVSLGEFISEIKRPGTLRFKSAKEPKLDKSYQISEGEAGEDVVIFLDDSSGLANNRQGKKLFAIGDENNVLYAPIENMKKRFSNFIERVDTVERTENLDDALEVRLT